MNANPLPTAATLSALARFSTPTICNAIERFRIRMRNEGYTGSHVPCRSSSSTPLLGYAFTVKMRTLSPPVSGLHYPADTAWWGQLSATPDPKVIVIQDMDQSPSSGSVAGEIRAAVFKAFGAIGLITNGAVRDLDAIAAMGMQVYAGSLSPSHAYAHVVDVGQPVEVAGLTLKNGDLVHGDRHGLTTIPLEIAAKLPAVAEEILAREAEVRDLCRQGASKLHELQALIATFDHFDAAS